MTEMEWAISIVCAYLFGSIPFGVIIAGMKGVDIRDHGSKNIGATNVGRVLGKKLGVLCLTLDTLKGTIPVFVVGSIAGIVGEPLNTYPTTTLILWIAVGIAPLLGHMYPIFLKFKGGKGVATTLGSMLGMYPILTIPILAAFACFMLALLASRIVSLASMFAAAGLPLSTYFSLKNKGVGVSDSWPLLVMTGFISVMVIWKHRSNLKRILKNEEPRIRV